MNSFRIVLLACFIGLACAQFDVNRLRDLLGDDADELFRRLDQTRRGRGSSSPFGRNPLEGRGSRGSSSPFGGRGSSSPFGRKPLGGRRDDHLDHLDPFDPFDSFEGFPKPGPGQRIPKPPSQRTPSPPSERVPSPPRRDSRPSTPTSGLLDKSDCVCRMKGSARIVNGQEAVANGIPWQVSLASYNQYVLTAAHCVDSKTAMQVQVRVGLHYLKDANSRNTYAVKKIHMHPYSTPSKPGDYALLELKNPIDFIKGSVEPGCISNVVQTYDGDLIASGWGTTTISRKDLRTGQLRTGEVSRVLKKANLHQDKGECENYLICVNSDNGDSVCQGDSGGPLHYIRNGRAAIEGVASFVTGQSSYGSSSVELCTGHGAYSANHYYKGWFEKIIGQNYCKL